MNKNKRYDDISDDEIRIIGNSGDTPNIKRMVIIALAALLVVGLVVAVVMFSTESAPTPAPVKKQVEIPIYGEEKVVVETDDTSVKQ